MLKQRRVWVLAAVLVALGAGRGFAQEKKARLFVVSSYHREYLWSQDTHEGVCAALRDFGFLSPEEIDTYTKNDYVDGEKTVVQKAWMDSKRKNSKGEKLDEAARIIEEINAFHPDLIFLGDDNAANLIGSQYIDANIPVVFWGINGIPLKYDLLDSLEHPGHNVTGVYQRGYIVDALTYLHKLLPGIRTFATLSDDSETGRVKAKEIEQLAETGQLPILLKESVITNSYEQWQAAALRLQGEVDAFFISNHNTLRDSQDKVVDQMDAGAWYLTHIQLPECSMEKQFAQEGILLVVDDSGYKQGYEAVRMAKAILKEGQAPAGIPVISPERGAIFVNRQRAKMLGIDLAGKDFIEDYIDQAEALSGAHPVEPK